MRFKQWQVITVLVMLTALMLAGCDGDSSTDADTPVPTPTDAPAGMTQITLVKEAIGMGDPAVTYMLTVDVPAGTYTLEEKDADPVEGTVPAEPIEALEAKLDEASFWDFEEDYIPDDGTCCDFVYFTIGVTRGGETTTSRGSESEGPEVFMDLVNMVEALATP